LGSRFFYRDTLCGVETRIVIRASSLVTYNPKRKTIQASKPYTDNQTQPKMALFYFGEKC